MNGQPVATCLLSRRRFVQGAGALGLGLLAGCGRLPGTGQPLQRGRPARVGFLGNTGAPADESSTFTAFQQGLRDHGYLDGNDIIIERRDANLDPSRFQTIAAEFVSLPVDVIVTPTAQGALAAREASGTIPIVITAGGDPVALGLVASLAQPGGNVTGLSTMSATLSGKRLELLHEVGPGISRVAILTDSTNPSGANQLRETQAAARTLGLDTVMIDLQAPGGLEGGFEAIIRERAEALCVLVIATGPQSARIASFASSADLPSAFGLRAGADSGGLMSLGADRTALSRRAAYYVDRILKGTKPADLPIEQPTTFDFVINLKTAQALGLTIPQHVLLQATEVIQ
ncbi:MAG TPA: ABC transporter substrate-binding protein [Chloroflexota bacterium]|jgi:putative ABC transport system substrate-binding protein